MVERLQAILLVRLLKAGCLRLSSLKPGHRLWLSGAIASRWQKGLCIEVCVDRAELADLGWQDASGDRGPFGLDVEQSKRLIWSISASTCSQNFSDKRRPGFRWKNTKLNRFYTRSKLYL